jgi:uncharacterized protein (TIGR01777 family)
MRVFVTGGTGLIGRRLVRQLRDDNHSVRVLTRSASGAQRLPDLAGAEIVVGDPTLAGDWQAQVDGCDAVVHLAGHNVFAERWSPAVKRRIRDSRVLSTQQVVAAIGRAAQRPGVLVQASALGYYGPRGDEVLDESSPPGADFLATICREWEAAAQPAEALGVRVAWIRVGIVLAKGEGALGVMTPLFRIGPGAPVGGSHPFLPGTGTQWMSWIHVDDIVGLFRFAVDTPAASGPINGTAPHPERNVDFTRALSRVLWKPYAFWRVGLPIGPPAILLRVALGEVADVITQGQRVRPARAEALGFRSQFPDLEPALRDVLRGRAARTG